MYNEASLAKIGIVQMYNVQQLSDLSSMGLLICIIVDVLALLILFDRVHGSKALDRR